MSSLEYESGKLNLNNNYRDPGEVNVHQFYPILEYSFSKQLVNLDEELFHSATEKLGPEYKDGGFTKKLGPEDKDGGFTEKLGPEYKDGGFKEKVEQNHASEDQHGECENEEEKTEKCGKMREVEERRNLVDNNRTESLRSGKDSDSNNIQGGVFSTAVSEESIEAAKLRSKEIFHTEDWRSDRQLRYGRSMRIVIKKANEYFLQAMKEKEEKNFVGVITYLNKAINLKSEDPVFYVERGETYLFLCDIQSAILNYKKACLLATNNHDYQSKLAFLYCFHGQTLFDQRLFSEALVSFSKASKMVPENVGYQARVLACLAALQKHNQCLDLVNKRLEEDNNSPDLHILRARLHEISANTNLCYQDVRKALLLNPHHPEAQSMMDAFVKRATCNKLLAMQLSIQGKDREALQKISLAIQTQASLADYYILRGALHRKLRDFNSAVDDFLLALDKCDHKEEDPVFRNAQRQLLLTFNDFAVECFNKGYYEEAILLLTKALKEKNEKSLYVNRGDCFLKLDELSFALQDYQQALELDPQDQTIKFRISLVCNELGVCLYEQANYIDAETELTQALKYSPLVGQYYISRSRVRYMLKDLTGAREDFLHSLLLSPSNDGIMSISSRLFPGKSIADIISSPAAKHVQVKLHSLVTTNTAGRLTQLGISEATDHATDFGEAPKYSTGHGKTTEYATGHGETTEYATGHGETTEYATDHGETTEYATDYGEGQTFLQSEEVWQSAGSRMNFALCIKEREFYVKQVQEKRKIDNKVKDVLLNRESLHYNGPHILPLPPPVSKISGTSLQGHKQSLAAVMIKAKSSDQN